jgi:hypothetical protein
MTARGLMPIAEYNAHAAPRNQVGGRSFNLSGINHTNSGPLSSSGSDSPRALPPKTTHGKLPPKVERSSALPSADLLQFIHTFLGERAVMRETVKKAAPAFRRYAGEF